jgi:hypothetical protein
MPDLTATTTEENLLACWDHTLEVFDLIFTAGRMSFIDGHYSKAFIELAAAAHLMQDLTALARALDEAE